MLEKSHYFADKYIQQIRSIRQQPTHKKKHKHTTKFQLTDPVNGLILNDDRKLFGSAGTALQLLICNGNELTKIELFTATFFPAFSSLISKGINGTLKK